MGGSTKKFIPEGDNVQIFLFVFVVFFIKVYLVQFSYNYIGPKLMEDFGNVSRSKQFEPMSFTQAIFLVILFNNLFR